MRTILSLSLAYCALAFVSTASAQITIAPLTTFGGGDGWISPDESATDFLFSTGDTERGLGYNPVTNHLYYVSRSGGLNARILDATTGADIGALDVTGIAGGTFTLSKIAVGDDGVIYGTNLRNGSTSTLNYKIYRWTTESAAPQTIFDAMPDTLSTATTAGPRLGDNLDVIGSGAATRLVAGYGTTTSPNSNGYAVIDPTASAANPTAPVFTNVSFPEGTGAGQTSDGDFRLGVTFISGGASGTVIGTQGTSTTSARLTDYSGTTGTIPGTLRMKLTLQVASERVMDFATVGGVPLLATMEAGGTATTPLLTSGTIRLYDMSNPEAPVFLTSFTNMTGTPFINTNSAGDLRWGQINGNTATLYALNTNNGIQAFVVSVPEPSMAGLCSIGLLGLLSRRNRRS